jgi:hypothetical protein
MSAMGPRKVIKLFPFKEYMQISEQGNAIAQDIIGRMRGTEKNGHFIMGTRQEVYQ